ncbi:hypothetical protein FRC00_011790, partial [Tulasnella sp. 408]
TTITDPERVPTTTANRFDRRQLHALLGELINTGSLFVAGQANEADSSTRRAGRTMSDRFGPHGRLRAEEQTQTAQSNAGTYTVTIKAPHFALAFLDNQDSIDPIESTPTTLSVYQLTWCKNCFSWSNVPRQSSTF